MKFLKDFIRGFLWFAGLAWGALGITLHGLIVSFLLDKDKEMMIFIEASLICVVTFPPLFFILLLLLEKPACVDISVKGFRVAVLAPLILIFTYATISNCRRRMNANSKAV